MEGKGTWISAVVGSDPIAISVGDKLIIEDVSEMTIRNDIQLMVTMIDSKSGERLQRYFAHNPVLQKQVKGTIMKIEGLSDAGADMQGILQPMLVTFENP